MCREHTIGQVTALVCMSFEPLPLELTESAVYIVSLFTRLVQPSTTILNHMLGVCIDTKKNGVISTCVNIGDSVRVFPVTTEGTSLVRSLRWHHVQENCYAHTTNKNQAHQGTGGSSNTGTMTRTTFHEHLMH